MPRLHGVNTNLSDFDLLHQLDPSGRNFSTDCHSVEKRIALAASNAS
jgi:hypothetical protein